MENLKLVLLVITASITVICTLIPFTIMVYKAGCQIWQDALSYPSGCSRGGNSAEYSIAFFFLKLFRKVNGTLGNFSKR